jgi:hypothetical protein
MSNATWPSRFGTWHDRVRGNDDGTLDVSKPDRVFWTVCYSTLVSFGPIVCLRPCTINTYAPGRRVQPRPGYTPQKSGCSLGPKLRVMQYAWRW